MPAVPPVLDKVWSREVVLLNVVVSNAYERLRVNISPSTPP